MEWGNAENASLKVSFKTLFAEKPTPTVLDLPNPIRLWKKAHHEHVNRKSCRYMVAGVWNNNRGICESFYRLSKLCVALKRGDIGQGWILVGCQDEVFAKYVKVSGKKKPAVQAGFDNSSPPEGAIDLSEVPIEFRSAEDPFIVLQRVTGGKLYFGQSEGEMRLKGVLLLLVGLFLSLPCCYYSWRGTIRSYVMPGDASDGGDREYDDLFDERDDL